MYPLSFTLSTFFYVRNPCKRTNEGESEERDVNVLCMFSLDRVSTSISNFGLYS